MKSSRVCLMFVTMSLLVTMGVSQNTSKVRLEGDAARRQLLAEIQGKPAPELEVKDWISGKPLKISELKGKVVMIDFWGKW